MSHILPTATLGRTGLEVTRLGFGAGHRRAMTDEEMNAQLNAVLDAGINFIDTANDYGNSEEMIGRYLRHRRHEFVLATKCGCHPDGHIWTRENLFPRPPPKPRPSARRLRRHYAAAQPDRYPM